MGDLPIVLCKVQSLDEMGLPQPLNQLVYPGHLTIKCGHIVEFPIVITKLEDAVFFGTITIGLRIDGECFGSLTLWSNVDRPTAGSSRGSLGGGLFRRGHSSQSKPGQSFPNSRGKGRSFTTPTCQEHIECLHEHK